MSVSTTWVLSLKIILISTGAISIAMAIKFSVPSVVAFTCYDLPVVWNSLRTWLKPPYLYFIINGIIITIAASARFNHHHHHNQSKDSNKDSVSYQLQEPLVSVKAPPPPPTDVVAAAVLRAQHEPELNMNAVGAPVPLPPVVEEEVYAAEAENDEAEEEPNVVELKPVAENGVLTDDVAKDDWMVPESSFTPPQKIVSPEAQLDFLLPVEEKPLLSSRFGHRKPIKTSPEGGRALRVARPKRQETLENTWKTITEGRHVPLTRHLKKSDTWENHSRENSLDQVPKSETFKDRTNYAGPTAQPTSLSPIPGKIKKEPSLSQDELNRRVEAFIKKFNEEMRLQRQQSFNQYMEMINRGAY